MGGVRGAPTEAWSGGKTAFALARLGSTHLTRHVRGGMSYAAWGLKIDVTAGVCFSVGAVRRGQCGREITGGEIPETWTGRAWGDSQP